MRKISATPSIPKRLMKYCNACPDGYKLEVCVQVLGLDLVRELMRILRD